MKNCALASLLALGAFTLQACDDDDDVDNPKLPNTVQQNFAARYPGVEYAEWEQEKSTKKYTGDFYYYGRQEEWNVEFAGVEAKAWYLSTGAWEKTEFDVMSLYRNPNDAFISEDVRNVIQTRAAGREIDLDAIDTPNEDYFLLEIDKEPRDEYVKISFDGSVIP